MVNVAFNYIVQHMNGHVYYTGYANGMKIGTLADPKYPADGKRYTGMGQTIDTNQAVSGSTGLMFRARVDGADRVNTKFSNTNFQNMG